MSVPMIAGLYPYTRGGITHPPRFTLREIPASLRVNPGYLEDLLILAGDRLAAEQLSSFGLQVHRVFDDAPAEIQRDTAHKMKHWMCLWALREFGEFLWVDWDTVLLRHPDEDFWSYCRTAGTPKFLRIPNYWATVNCGVYYASQAWLPDMERSFGADMAEPNDELLWMSVLPKDVDERGEFWWGDRVAQIWNRDDFESVTKQTYFAHVKHLDWADDLRTIHRSKEA
ncbi:hypothetical protein FRC98_07000 [Lujinxingia vulgaris]|uniref:Glycosyltransferase n=1 Tax=Lujinxingia vulgaris TaxID=2600176 RepID=A0A5C6XEX0_9DELT|nr:hypothetical protein [Lujinxingia vulgaris]TXD37437.1 hypothetical protein FRC98_07000 [Lujinxingia vulgaris]